METWTSQQIPERDAREHIANCRDKRFLEKRYIDAFKGRGVFTRKAIKLSEFVVEYRGDIKTNAKPKKNCDDVLYNYLFEFSWKGEHWCVDASKEDETLGRLVNDDHINPNCEMRKIVSQGKPHLCLFAVKDISPGDEITYNYGDAVYPWRIKLEAASSNGNSGSPLQKSTQEMQLETSCTLQKETASSCEEQDSDEDYVPSKAPGKSKDSFSRRKCKNYCYVCGKGFFKIARHLKTHADEEPDIAKVIALPKSSKERKKLLGLLRNRGNYNHNQEVLRNNSGELKLRRQPTKPFDVKELLHCPYCKAMFIRNEMWRHAARCDFRSTSKAATEGRTKILTEIALTESPFTQALPSNVKKMLLTMKQDRIASVVQNDFLLIQLAQCLSEKFEQKPVKYDYARQTLREMGRLLLVLQEKSVLGLEDAIKPKNFYKVVEAVKYVAEFNQKRQKYNKPRLALRLGQSLKKIGNIALNCADDNKVIISETEHFLKLCATEWSHRSQTAHMSWRQVSNPSTVLFTQDVQLFFCYLETFSVSATESLMKCKDKQPYSALCRATLTQATVLNKCAPEVSKMTLKAFQERGDTTQVLSKRFIRINTLSKTGQSIAILLTSELVSATTLLVSEREACGVHQENPFLFARPNSSSTSRFRGSNCIRAFSHLCRAKNPEHFRLPNLHKHIARVFQILNLENDELGHLAKLLGHDIRTDRGHYRLPEAAVELAKIAKLLLAMERGSLGRFKGNSLEEIEIEDELEPDEEQDNDEADNVGMDICSQRSDVVVESQTKQLTPKQDALEHISAGRDKPFLEEKFIDHMNGRGVFTRELIEPSSFVLEYRGDLISHRGSRKRKHGDSLENYLFDFSWKGTNWHIDASKEDGSLGRLVNHNHENPNCIMKKVVHKGKPHLCLFAVKKISPDEEITYNNGDSSYPWRSADDDSMGASSSAESGSDEREPSSAKKQHVKNKPRSHSPPEQSPEWHHSDASCAQQEDEPDDGSDEKPDDGSDEEPKARSSNPGSRNYCYVCGKASFQITRHLFKHRNEELDIAKAFSLPVYSKERIKLLNKLRKKGNDKHPLEMSCEEPNTSSNAETMALCVYCKYPYTRKSIQQHMQSCSDVMKLVQMLKKDEILSLVANDPLILQVAQQLWNTGELKAKSETIKCNMRIMGKLLLILRKESVCSLDDAIRPQNFCKVVRAVRALASFDAEMTSGDAPCRKKNLGNLLKTIINSKLASALIKNADQHTVQEVKTFLKMWKEEWDRVVPPGVKPAPTVPFIHSVQLLYQYVETTEDSALQSLTLYESPPVYTALLRVTVAHLSVLNKNIADVSQVSLQSFIEREEPEHHDDSAAGQSQWNQLLSKTFLKIHVRSQSGQNLPVTLTPKLLSAVTLLVSKRKTCGVHVDNPFLFGIPHSPQTSFYSGKQSFNTVVNRCSAKNKAELRSLYFFKHIRRVFQALSLNTEELGQLARLLGRDIRTDAEYYHSPEAAVDVAKLSMLLSAMESGTLERFEGQSLEEIEIADVLEPTVDKDSSENSDTEGSESCSPTHLRANKAAASASSPGSSAKKSTRALSWRKRGRGKRRRWASESETSEGENTSKESCDVNTAEKTPRSNQEASAASFSDDDEDLNVDFDMDTDEDDVPRAEPSSPDLPDMATPNSDSSDTNEPEETTDMDSVGHVEKDDQKKTEDSGSSSALPITEKNNKPSAAVMGLKEVKIMIHKLDITEFVTRAHVSKSPISRLEKEQPVRHAATNIRNDPRAVNMSCAACSMVLMTGQTAYQKKGFAKVFCSQNCLFTLFPTNKPASSTCHYCHRAVLQPLDLIMAAVDAKGTMKDFCGVTCLSSFKSDNTPLLQPPSACSMCSKPCTAACELTLNEAVHKFCSNSCLEDFRRDNVTRCQSCGSTCNRTPLTVMLDRETKTICTNKCLKNFKKISKILIRCSGCNTSSVQLPDMVHYKTEKNTVEFFCSPTCLVSCSVLTKKAEKSSAGETNHTEIPAAEPEKPTIVILESCVVCSQCGVEQQIGQSVYRSQNSSEVFCMAGCLFEKQPQLRTVKKCFNCFQEISRPHNVILAPVDVSGTRKELCSNTCLTSINSRRKASAPNLVLPPFQKSRTECKICSRYCSCTNRQTHDGVTLKICSDACFINYHKVKNLFVCEVCCSLCSDKRLMLKDGRKTICGEECLVKFKEKNKMLQRCTMCQTSHQMSDMVESESDEGLLDFFCSNRCMTVHKSMQSVTTPEKKSPKFEEIDSKEVTPSLLNLESIKMEPSDAEDNNQSVLSATPTEDLKDKMKVVKDLKNEADSLDFLITQLKVDAVETVEDFCSQTCPSGKAAPSGSKSQCEMCSRYLISKHEITYQGVSHKICSNPCFYRFCDINNFCINCHAHCNTPVQLKAGDGSRKFCTAGCLALFKQKTKTLQPCALCCSTQLTSHMFEKKNNDGVVELFCTKSCVMASKIQAINASAVSLDCDNCGNTTIPACHLATSDTTIRSFCGLTCAMAFKETQSSSSHPAAASDHTHSDVLKEPDNMRCAHCQSILKTTPNVVEKEGKVNFTCSLACSEEFRKVSNIVGNCEYCSNERIIQRMVRVDGKDCCLCSEGCLMLLRHQLDMKWGDHCRSCAHCLCISKTVVTAKYDATEEQFCSKECSLKYNMLLCNVARCDACGREGKLKEGLRTLAEVRHFCDLKCLLRFFNKKVTAVSSPPRYAEAPPPSPVAANVSLADALAVQPEASARSAAHVSAPDIPAKVLRHAAVQTVPKELKNKSILCTTMVHNKGVSCTAQTVHTDAQTDAFVPRMSVLPVPVPVYMPLPLNTHCQFTPQPLVLPLLLPVPIFLPGKPGDAGATTEKTQAERKETEDGPKDRVEGPRPENDPANDHHSSSNKDNFSSLPSEPQPSGHQSSTQPAASLLQEAAMDREGQRLQQPYNATEPKAHRDVSQARQGKRCKLKGRAGIEAWKRWIQCRESGTSLDPGPSPAVTFNQDVLQCSEAELSEGLVCFITEVKRPDGQPYPPDCLFYLCLSIQQYLLQHSRLVNIFSDGVYCKFSELLTKMLRGFKPLVTTSGDVCSSVEEGFLWDCKQLGAYSPIVLLNTLLFFCCKYFGFTTLEQHRQLSFGHIKSFTKTERNDTETTYLSFCPPFSDTDGVPAKKRKKQRNGDILEMNMQNPLRCPVRLYNLYLSKCSESAKRQANMFYLQPDPSCVPSSQVWFSSTPLDSRTLEAMLVRILTVRELHRITPVDQ